MNNQLPLISCICVTREKPSLLKRAIDCFLAQTYPNKELVILYEDDDYATEELVGAGFPDNSSIRLSKVPAYPKTALGELRNLAVRSAGGEFICQWDDDDWYHSRRLEQQYEGLFSDGRHGSVIVQWIVFDAITSTAYLSHVRLWEGSILCRKNILQLKAYADKTVGEDTKTIEYLAQMDHLHFLTGLPGLYIYVYHGSNTWNYDHWSAIFRFSTELSKEESSVVEDILNGKYSVHEGSLLLDGILEQSFSAPIVVP